MLVQPPNRAGALTGGSESCFREACSGAQLSHCSSSDASTWNYHASLGQATDAQWAGALEDLALGWQSSSPPVSKSRPGNVKGPGRARRGTRSPWHEARLTNVESFDRAIPRQRNIWSPPDRSTKAEINGTIGEDKPCYEMQATQPYTAQLELVPLRRSHGVRQYPGTAAGHSSHAMGAFSTIPSPCIKSQSKRP